VIRIFGEIVLAALLGDTIRMGELIYFYRVTLLAASSGMAIYNSLNRNGNIWESSVTGNIDSVGDRAGGTLSPAASAVNWVVLISAPRKVVNSFVVSPVEILWQLFDVDVFVRTRRSNDFGNRAS